jgi:hypothetical protein
MGLTERSHRNVDLTYWEGEIPVNYVYTYGLGLEKFFRTLMDEGKFLASRCDGCGITYLPARIFCERCLGGLEETFTVSGTGRVYAYTVVHLGMDDSPKEDPVIVAAVDIDGTDCRIVHYLVDVDPGDVKVGMAVKPRLRPKKDRRGHIEDIEGFVPA